MVESVRPLLIQFFHFLISSRFFNSFLGLGGRWFVLLRFLIRNRVWTGRNTETLLLTAPITDTVDRSTKVLSFEGDESSAFFASRFSFFSLYEGVASNASRYTSITPVLKNLHWLPVEHRSVFKTATLVYKFLHTGFPKYFAPYISSYSSSYSTRRSQSGGNFLVIPKFQPSIHKSVKQFGHSFAFDAPTIWNALPEKIRASPSLASFRKRLKIHLYTKAYPP